MQTLERPSDTTVAPPPPQAGHQQAPEGTLPEIQGVPFFSEADIKMLTQTAARIATLSLARLGPQVQDLVGRGRGDRQKPDEPNRGFSIEHLEGSPQQPVPVGEVLPWDKDFRAQDFARQYVDGSTPVKMVGDASGRPSFVAYFKIPASKYEEAVAAGKVQPGIFGTEGKVAHVKPGAEALDSLVDDDQKQATVEAYYYQQAANVQANYIDDLGGIEDREELGELLEAYEFTDGNDDGRTIRLLNFSSDSEHGSRIKLSEEQLRQAANAIRSVSDKGSGEVFERLHTIVILPEGHPNLRHRVRDEDGVFDLPYSGEARNGTIYISERSIRRPEDRKPRPERVERYWANYFEEFRLAGEPQSGPGSPETTAAMFDWEILLVHELEHIALPENSVELEGPGPTLYSRVRKREQEAELGAIDYKGGYQNFLVPEGQRRSKREMWWRQRGGDDKGLMHERPIGPRFVVCRELDITQGPLPVRLKNPDRPLPTEVYYRLVPEA